MTNSCAICQKPEDGFLYEVPLCQSCHPLAGEGLCKPCIRRFREYLLPYWLDDLPSLTWRCGLHHKFCRQCQLERSYMVCRGCQVLMPTDSCPCECCTSHCFAERLCDCCRLLSEEASPVLTEDWKVEMDV